MGDIRSMSLITTKSFADARVGKIKMNVNKKINNTMNKLEKFKKTMNDGQILERKTKYICMNKFLHIVPDFLSLG